MEHKISYNSFTSTSLILVGGIQTKASGKITNESIQDIHLTLNETVAVIRKRIIFVFFITRVIVLNPFGFARRSRSWWGGSSSRSCW